MSLDRNHRIKNGKRKTYDRGTVNQSCEQETFPSQEKKQHLTLQRKTSTQTWLLINGPEQLQREKKFCSESRKSFWSFSRNKWIFFFYIATSRLQFVFVKNFGSFTSLIFYLYTALLYIDRISQVITGQHLQSEMSLSYLRKFYFSRQWKQVHLILLCFDSCFIEPVLLNFYFFPTMRHPN